MRNTFVVQRLNNKLSIFIIVTTLLLSACNKNQYSKGDAFPISALQTLIKTTKKPINLSGKILIINFWATWCTPCREEMPSLQKLSDTLNPSQFRIIGISIDDDINLMTEFLLQNKIYFNHYLDSKKIVSEKKLNIQAYPETIIVAPNGIIIKRVTGGQNWTKQFLEKILQQENYKI